MLGQSVRSKVNEIVRGSIVTRIMRETRNTDIVVVANPDKVSSTDETAGDG